MPSKKKPWRTIVLTGDTGRFTWEQLHEAVRKAMVREQARKSGERKPARVGDVPTAKSASGARKPLSDRVVA